MIRAGKLSRTIEIHRNTETVGASGAVARDWVPIHVTRAEILDPATIERETRFGEASYGLRIMQIRHLNDLRTTDRVVCDYISPTDHTAYDIKEIHEVGRRKALRLVLRRRPE